jgi:hypothetical protein
LIDENFESGEEPQPKNDISTMIKYHEEFGWPLIPKRGNVQLKQLKAIVRTYVMAMYRE